jgi:wobble nucleotide-excising tRNase
MIESISISTVATYRGAPELLSGLKGVNYLFGANASGKTTISRLIADEGSSLESKVTWAAGRKLRAMVYNQDYVEKNFNQPRELKGVFTLGAKDAAVLIP